MITIRTKTLEVVHTVFASATIGAWLTGTVINVFLACLSLISCCTAEMHNTRSVCEYLANCYTATILPCPTRISCCTAETHSTRSVCKYLANCYTGTVLPCPTLPVCCRAELHNTGSVCTYLANCYTGTIYLTKSYPHILLHSWNTQGLCVNTWLTVTQIPSYHVLPSYPAAQLKHTRSVCKYLANCYTGTILPCPTLISCCTAETHKVCV